MTWTFLDCFFNEIYPSAEVFVSVFAEQCLDGAIGTYCINGVFRKDTDIIWLGKWTCIFTQQCSIALFNQSQSLYPVKNIEGYRNQEQLFSL